MLKTFYVFRSSSFPSDEYCGVTYTRYVKIREQKNIFDTVEWI